LRGEKSGPVHDLVVFTNEGTAKPHDLNAVSLEESERVVAESGKHFGFRKGAQ